jgi:uncharacterized protein YbdZ (MbtH family)
MTQTLPPDLQDIERQLDAAERDAASLVAGLDDISAGWRETAESWSVAECLDHLATANNVYLRAMLPAAWRARAHKWMRKGPALPGVVGRMFVQWMEPPVKRRRRSNAPRLIRPREAPGLADAYAAFLLSQDRVRAFVRAQGDLDLRGVHFVNPFVRGVRFSLATGLHVITSHERRHLWQAWNVRNRIPGVVPRPGKDATPGVLARVAL